MRIKWDQLGERLYKAGLDRGVLYQYSGGDYLNGVAWNGLTEVSTSNGGHEKTPLYTNDVKAAIVFSPQESDGSIDAYCYPDEFEPCLGLDQVSSNVSGLIAHGQTFMPFGLSYRSQIGNDLEGSDYAYEIHLIYNAFVVSNGDRHYSSISNDPNIDTMSWDFETIPVEVGDLEPASEFTIDSRRISAEKLAGLEDILYGTDDTEARLPFLQELIEYLEEE